MIANKTNSEKFSVVCLDLSSQIFLRDSSVSFLEIFSLTVKVHFFNENSWTNWNIRCGLSIFSLTFLVMSARVLLSGQSDGYFRSRDAVNLHSYAYLFYNGVIWCVISLPMYLLMYDFSYSLFKR